jgi:hypothetical protein
VRKQQHVLDHRRQGVQSRDDFIGRSRVTTAGRQSAADHLNRPAHAGQRVAPFVRHHRRHFPEFRERRLFTQAAPPSPRAR